MTKKLPPQANLDWLRKTAKQLHKAWQSDGRADKLSDAQFAIAREYGFPSWRAMKQEIDATTAPPSDPTNPDEFMRNVGEGNIAALELALKQQPDLVNLVADHPYWGGRPQPLQVAMDTNREDVFDLLLAAGADVDARAAEYDNWSPLMLALARSRPSMVTKLRDRGAQGGLCVTLLDGDDAGLGTYLSDPSWKDIPVPKGSLIGLARTPFAVDQLIAAGVSPDGKDRWGSNAMDTLSRLGPKGAPLVAALAHHGVPTSARILVRMGDFASLKDLHAAGTPVVTDPAALMAAVDFSHQDILLWLLEQGADVNARHDFAARATALHSAAWNGDLAIVECLLAHGADVTAIDEEYGTTAQVWAEVARKITNNPACDAVAQRIADAGSP